eukprot:575264-Rhodomonas_salina.2
MHRPASVFPHSAQSKTRSLSIAVYLFLVVSFGLCAQSAMSGPDRASCMLFLASGRRILSAIVGRRIRYKFVCTPPPGQSTTRLPPIPALTERIVVQRPVLTSHILLLATYHGQY